MRALPRSKPLRFRFSGTPQRHRLSWACVPFLGLSRRPGAWQAHTPQVGRCILSRPLYQPVGFLGAQQERCLRCAMRLLWGADLWLQPSWWMSTVQDPRKPWLATGSLLTVWWRMPSLRPRLSLAFWLWLLLACLSVSVVGMGLSVAG